MEIIEIMPPAVKTDMTADLSEGNGITLITTDNLVKLSFASLKAGATASTSRPIQATRADAPRRPRFHQSSALESLQKVRTRRLGLDSMSTMLNELTW